MESRIFKPAAVGRFSSSTGKSGAMAGMLAAISHRLAWILHYREIRRIFVAGIGDFKCVA
ncbi:MAG: hypothetical protein CMK72_05770 [Pseudomonadaceae bacterium]|nr:hypothetical protein [Pseudomonadaceae bacterium]|tara:strand:- start:453 stop:632 length:180 start_codon:yes stop_codon:yes gene_type:complete